MLMAEYYGVASGTTAVNFGSDKALDYSRGMAQKLGGKEMMICAPSLRRWGLWRRHMIKKLLDLIRDMKIAKSVSVRDAMQNNRETALPSRPVPSPEPPLPFREVLVIPSGWSYVDVGDDRLIPMPKNIRIP